MRHRNDYPEPLYTMPRSQAPVWSAPVSPLTQTASPISPDDPRPSEEVSGSSKRVRQDSPSAEGPAHRREAAMPPPPVDSAIEHGTIGLRYDSMPTGEPPVEYWTARQHLQAETAELDRLASHRLSDVFIFGRGSRQSVQSTGAAPAANLQQSEAIGSWVAGPTARKSRFVEDMEMLQPEPKRFRRFAGSLKKSVGNISASVKQIVGRKRSRDEDEEIIEEERCRKVARPHCATVAFVPRHVVVPLPATPTPAVAPPTPTQQRPSTDSRPAVDAEVQPFLQDVTQPDPCTRSQSPDMEWTGEERRVFGAYVRAAEGNGGIWKWIE